MDLNPTWLRFALQLAKRLASQSASGILRGSWDLVSGVVNTVTILTTTYNPSYKVLITLLTKSHDPPSIPQGLLRAP